MIATLLVVAAIAFFLTMPPAVKKGCTEHFRQLWQRGKKVATNCAGIEKKNGKMSMLISVGLMTYRHRENTVLQFNCEHCNDSFSEALDLGQYTFEHNCPNEWKLSSMPRKTSSPKI